MFAIAESARIVYETIEKRKNATELLNARLKRYPDKNIRQRITLYVKNYLRNFFVYSAILDKYSKKKRLTSKVLRHIIQMGISITYSLQPDKPGYYVNATVNVVKAEFGPKMANLANAILRETIRQREKIGEYIASLPDFIKYSFPQEIYEYIIEGYGARKGKEIIKNLNREPAANFFYILESDRKELENFQKKLISDGAKVELNNDQRYLEVRGDFSLDRVPEFLIKMDLPFIYAINIAHEIARGRTFLDLFSGIGNKFLGIAGVFERAVAVDRNIKKLRHLKERIKEQAYRADIICGDSQFVLSFVKPDFDFILLDVPCTGFGTLSRKPDIRYHYNLSDAVHLGARDVQYIKLAEKRLRPGGYIMYVTCTLTFEENEWVVEEVLKTTELTLVDLGAFADFEFIEARKHLKFLPIGYNQIGGFIALFKR